MSNCNCGDKPKRYAGGGIVDEGALSRNRPSLGDMHVGSEYNPLSLMSMANLYGILPEGVRNILEGNISKNPELALRELAGRLPERGEDPAKLLDVVGPHIPGMAGVIKSKGGNWLAGDVENAIKGLKQGYFAATPEELPSILANSDGARPGYISAVSSLNAMNQWLDQKLAKYIKNEMATPEDPIRAMAERGVLHVPPEQLNVVDSAINPPPWLAKKRGAEGFSPEGLGVSNPARRWETMADLSIGVNSPLDYMTPINIDKNPWLLKVPTNTKVNQLVSQSELVDDLGFNHLTDELRNAINPNTDLPANLRWKYSDLNKVTVPQAVQRVSDINAWRAANKAEANAKLANNAATVPFKDYPDADYQWVELRKPEELPSGFSEIKKPSGEVGAYYNSSGATVYDDPRIEPLRDALKYEGDTMGHCVGGYCDDVAEGRSKIYSLRNKKTGEPHTTIEVAPARVDPTQLVEGDSALSKAYSQPRIVQIKGKGNKAPVDKYLPYVQDFVRSGQWGDVGDLGNTRLIKNDPRLMGSVLRSEMRKAVGDGQVSSMNMNQLRYMEDQLAKRFNDTPYLTEQEVIDASNEIRALFGSDKPRPFADGGLVSEPQTSYNPDRVNALAQSLMDELNG